MILVKNQNKFGCSVRGERVPYTCSLTPKKSDIKNDGENRLSDKLKDERSRYSTKSNKLGGESTPFAI